MTEITVEGCRNLLANPTADLTPLERGLLQDVITLTEQLEAVRAALDAAEADAYLGSCCILVGTKHEPHASLISTNRIRVALGGGDAKAHESETERQTPEDHQRELKAWNANP